MIGTIEQYPDAEAARHVVSGLMTEVGGRHGEGNRSYVQGGVPCKLPRL